jgi:hypothetical protein
MAADNEKIFSLLLQLGIVGKEDLGAFKQMLGEVKDEAGDMTQSMPANLAGWEQYKNKLNEAGAGAEGLHGHLHNLRTLMAGAGPEARELGHLLHFAFNPLMLAGAAAGLGLEQTFKWIERIQERQHEMIEQAQKFNDLVREMINFGDTADEKFVKMSRTMAEMAMHGREVADALKTHLDYLELGKVAWDANREAAKAIADDTLTARDGMIDMLAAAGKITPLQAEKAKFADAENKKIVEAQAASDKAKADLDFKGAEKRQVDKTLRGLGSEEDVAIAKDDADDAAKSNKNVIDSHKGQVDLAGKVMRYFSGIIAQHFPHSDQPGELGGDAKKIIGGVTPDELKGISDKWEKLFATNKELFAGPGGSEAKEAFEKLVDTARTLNVANTNYQNAVKNQPGLDRAAITADANYDAFTKLTDQSKQLAGEIDKLKINAKTAADTLARVQADVARDTAVHDTTEAFKNGDTEKSIFEKGIAAMHELDQTQSRTGHGVDFFLRQGTPQQKQYYKNLLDQVQALKELEDALGNHGTTVIEFINKVVSKVVGGQQALHNATIDYLIGIESRMATMKSQIEQIPFHHR